MGAGKARCSLVVGSDSFRIDSGVGAWSPSLDEDLDPLIGEWWVGPTGAWGISGACILWYPIRKMDPWLIYFGFWCLMINTTKLD